VATFIPFSSWISAITTFAPFATNRRAEASPSPEAAPVMNATLPCSLQIRSISDA